MWIQSRSVQFGEHPFTHEVDLYLDTDLDQRCRVNRALDTNLVAVAIDFFCA